MHRIDSRVAAVPIFVVGVLQVAVLRSPAGLTSYIALLSTLLGVSCVFAAVALWCRGCLEARSASAALGAITAVGVLLYEAVGLPGVEAGPWGPLAVATLVASAAAVVLAVLASPSPARRHDPYAS